MFSKRIYALTTLTFLGFGSQTCDMCNCPKPKGQYFNIEGITTDSYRKRGGNAPEKLGSGQQTTLSDYFFTVDYKINYYSVEASRKRKAPFSLISSAYACDCIDDGALGSQERIKEFTVLTLNAFDAQHPANDTINELLTATVYATTYDLSTYLKADTATIKQRSYVLALKKKPETTSPFQAKVIIKLQNGEVYTATTLPVIIQ